MASRGLQHMAHASKCFVWRAGAAAPVVRRRADPAVVGAKYDVFINHRGVDTKRTVARLLYDRLVVHHRLNAFLDNMSMKPGDRLMERISEGVRSSRLAVAVFSPRYCDSEFCLRELSMLVEARKKIIPIFYDIKPSELRLPQSIVESHLPHVEKFQMALDEAKYTVGITFDSSTGDLAELVTRTSSIVLENVVSAAKTKYV